MAGANASESPLDAVTDAVGEPTIEAFELLSNETRLAILLALWEAMSPEPPLSEPSDRPVPFSELRERVGIRDSGQFNYHLDKLTGQFVESTEDGYLLTNAAEQVLSAIIAGTLSDHASFEGEPIDAHCSRCGGSVVIDYRDGTILQRCTDCKGIWREPGDPAGMLSKGYLPPVGLENRTPQEFHRQGNTWTRHRMFSMMEGACPRCSGTVTTHLNICEDHAAEDGTICDQCGSQFEIQANFVCDICKYSWWVPATLPMFTEESVKAFYYERGLDLDALYDASEMKQIADSINRVEVSADEPIEIVVTIEIEGDRLEVFLDDEARVTQVQTGD